MPELTPEERDRIYQEEKARHEARQSLERQSPTHGTASPSGSSGARLIGSLLLVGGIIGLVYFMFFVDTSVATNIPAGSEALGIQFPDRVNNLGLMADRQNGMIGSGVSAVLGAIFFIAGQPRR